LQLLTLLILGVFWLPADSGEKLGFAVTVLLAFSVFQLVINEQTPQNSDYNPLLGEHYYIMKKILRAGKTRAVCIKSSV